VGLWQKKREEVLAVDLFNCFEPRMKCDRGELRAVPLAAVLDPGEISENLLAGGAGGAKIQYGVFKYST
jgi:hypothetical protein